MYYSETTYGKYVTNHKAIGGLRTFDENVKIVNANIRRKAKSGKYIAVLDVYPDNIFRAKGPSIHVYFFDKYAYCTYTKEELIHKARYGY